MVDRVIVYVEHAGDLPEYASEGAVGADVKAYLTESVCILPGAVALIPTGLRCEIPEGYEIQVRPRSGLAWRYGVTVLNAPGTVDPDYRGEIKVLLVNHGDSPFYVEPGMRIAQLIVAPVVRACFLSADILSETARGHGGFGHTGVK